MIICSRFFVDKFTLSEHQRSKQHKQRVRELKTTPYSHEEADKAAGMGSYNIVTSATSPVPTSTMIVDSVAE